MQLLVQQVVYVELFRFDPIGYGVSLVRRVVQLSRAGNTRFHVEGLPLLEGIALNDVRIFRTRADNSEITEK